MGPGFFNAVASDHGLDAANLHKQFAKNNVKLCNLSTRKIYLLKCRKNHIFPKHIAVNVACAFQSIVENSPFTNKINNAIVRFKRQLLNFEIKITYWKLNALVKETDTLEQRILSAYLPSTEQFLSTQRVRYSNHHRSNMTRLNRKFDRLSENQLNTHIKANTENFIHNATSTVIPDDVKLLMGLGPKFSLPSVGSEIPVFSIIADVEAILNGRIEQSQRNEIRHTTASMLKTAVSRDNRSSFENFLLEKKKSCVNFLKEHDDIICIRSDKGAKTVFMEKSEYMKKADDLLNDAATYRKILDPTIGIQNINNKFVNKLHERDKIDRITKFKLTTHHATPPLMYFLPKHHKPNMPLRPITADLNGPTRNLADFATGILNKLQKSSYHIRNSYEFCEFINSEKFEEAEGMFSFDVVSLFTNAPVNKIMNILEKRWDEIAALTNLDKQEFMEMIEICTTNSYFAFNNQCYKQCYGTPMGAPISPILVELLMDDVLDKVQAKMEQKSRRIPILKKYVDDLFLLLPKNDVDEILSIFNSIEERIQFTFERETSNSIPFLDMTVFRDESIKGFYTRWYRKPVSSGRILNYKSIHPMSQKISTVRGFIDRVYRLSHSRFAEDNRKMLIDLLTMNDYPMRLVNRLINQYNKPKVIIASPNIVDNPIVAHCSLQYVPVISEKIAKSITSAVDNVRIAFKSQNNVGQLFSKLKDKQPITESTNVVYRIDCTGCPKCYIGMTGQKLCKRVRQHELDVIGNRQNKSALAYHSITTGHPFGFENVKVIEREQQYKKRCMLEELRIKASGNCVNQKSIDTRNVSDIYTSLFKTMNR